MNTYDVVIERDPEGWLVGSVPALPGCHSQAKTHEELIVRMKEAIELWLEVHTQEELVQHDFVGLERVHIG